MLFRSKSHVIYGDYWVDVNYGFRIPIAPFINPDGEYSVKLSSSTVTTVTSMGELVRNIDLAEDIFDASGVATEIQTAEDFGKTVKEAIEKIKAVFS